MANPWWALAEDNGQFTYFQATTAQAQARSKLTITYGGEQALYGPYTTKADAQAAVASGQDKPQQTGNPNPPVSNPLDFLGNIANAFGDLTQANTWVRLAKIVVGGALVIAGVIHLSGAGNAVKDVAGKIPIIP